MAKPLIFLSHITAESKLAKLLQANLVQEFSGYVDVFVSSDDRSIQSGTNFLTGITDGLINCSAAIYLISPESVKRPWINFELGAVWIRGAIAHREGKPHVHTIPVCHSGMTPSTLPIPLGVLNGVSGNDPDGLRRAFQDLQVATGGGGGVQLRTDFEKLAAEIAAFEVPNTVGAKLVKYMGYFLSPWEIQDLTKKVLARNPERGTYVRVPNRDLLEMGASLLRKEAGEPPLQGRVIPIYKHQYMGESGPGSTFDIDIQADLFLDCKELLLNVQ